MDLVDQATRSESPYAPDRMTNDLEIGDAQEAAALIAMGCLDDDAVGRVGLELEAHCFDFDDPLRRPSWAELSEIIAAVPALPGGSRITVEPGGAVELSGPPTDGAASAIAALQADRAVLNTEFSCRGMNLVLLGTDPVRPSHRINPDPRYQAMERFFEADGSATAGAAMMTSTASLQVNVNAGPRQDWARRIRLAHALGPTMIAITANSPMLNGRLTGWKSSRQRIWSQLDPARCGPFPRGEGTDPAGDWARQALRAPVMLVHTPHAVAVTDTVPLADWATGQVTLGGRRPRVADIEYHLSTLFPPVRPRRWLEIRYLDSVPDAIWPAVVFTLTTLLDDPEAAAVATEATATVDTAWDRAAQNGLSDSQLRESAVACVTAAAQRAPSNLVESLRALKYSVEQGRCPADDFTDRVAKYGIPAALAWSAAP